MATHTSPVNPPPDANQLSPIPTSPAPGPAGTADVSAALSHGNFQTEGNGTYTGTVFNNGPAAAFNLEARLSNTVGRPVSGTGSGWACDVTPTAAFCRNPGPFAAGAFSTITFTLAIGEGCSLADPALLEITSAPFDPEPRNNTAEDLPACVGAAHGGEAAPEVAAAAAPSGPAASGSQPAELISAAVPTPAVPTPVVPTPVAPTPVVPTPVAAAPVQPSIPTTGTHVARSVAEALLIAFFGAVLLYAGRPQNLGWASTPARETGGMIVAKISPAGWDGIISPGCADPPCGSGS
jgi:hypothetical protein